MENKIMRKILVKIIDNKIYFKNRRKLTENYQNMLNTNIISDNELLFSDEYIDQNKKIVKDYLNNIICQKNVNSVVIENNDLTILSLHHDKLDLQANFPIAPINILPDDAMPLLEDPDVEYALRQQEPHHLPPHPHNPWFPTNAAQMP